MLRRLFNLNFKAHIEKCSLEASETVKDLFCNVEKWQAQAITSHITNDVLLKLDCILAFPCMAIVITSWNGVLP